jgi:hypothetical protein
MRENVLDDKQLFFEIHAGNQMVFVPADVKNQGSCLGRIIGCGEAILYSRKVRPFRIFCHGEEPLQRGSSGSMLFAKLVDYRPPRDSQNPMFA